VRGSFFAFGAFVAAILMLSGCATRDIGVAASPANAPTAMPTPPGSVPSLVSLAPLVSPTPLATARGPIPRGYRITIARLGIDLSIAEGDLVRDIAEQGTPEGSAFHLPGTAFPGEGGNTFLYAHARRGMFLALWDVRPGDTLSVSTPDGRLLSYIVRDILPRVAPTDVSSTLATMTERLTLQTSTGPSPADPRFVVFAFPDDTEGR
jgi:hypothetical protein